jgi:hypothetical protein
MAGEAVAGVTWTVATGPGATVIADVPDALPLVAVIVAVPWAIADTRPLAETVATDEALDVHVIARPVSTVPPASRSVAVSCWV